MREGISNNSSQTLNRVDEVKNKLIDKFILIGSLLFLAIFVFTPWNEASFNIDVFVEFSTLILVFVIYWQRRRINVKVKTAVILVLIFIVFISDLIQFSIFSSDKDLLVLIPFLSILVYDLKTTILLFALALLSFVAIAFLSLEGLLGEPDYHYSVITAVDWFEQISTVLIIALVLTTFVYNFNESIIDFIIDLEKTNNDLNERDHLLEASLEEKNVMIQEIHHRVKNNLAVVSGLLELQSFNSDNSEFRFILSKSTNRIMSIAKVHEMLYESDDFSNIPFTKYVEDLSKIVASSINKDDKIINFDFDIQVDTLNINHGVPLGVIFNELITNSIKYGFVDSEDNLISISVTRSDDQMKVVYFDNGVGIDDFEEISSKSLGLTLIQSLMSQIEATYEFDTLDKFQLSFEFPVTQSYGPYQKHQIT